MFKSHIEETITVVLAMVMGIIMALVSIVVEGLDFNFPNVFKMWSMITMVILLASIIIPYKKWSEKFTDLFHLQKKSMLYKLVDNILPSLILNTCSTVVVSAANIFHNEAIPAEMQMEEWIQGIMHSWPIMLIISYFAAFAAVAVGKQVASRYCD